MMTNRPPVPRTVGDLTALCLKGEQRDVEFKEFVRDKPTIRKVVQAVAAMANLRNGGLVVLGVEDKTRALRGLSESELALWADRDKARSAVNALLDPAVDFESHRVGDCVVLEVRPFAKTPIIARVSKGESHQPDGLVEGSLFYRSSVTTSSAPISRLEDWTELRETLLLRAQAGAKRLEDDRRRAERQAEEDRIHEILRSAQNTAIPRVLKDEPERLGSIGRLLTNFRLFQIRSQQGEAKSNLKSAYTALRSYFQETDRYPSTLDDAGFNPARGGRYVYRAVDGEIVGAEQRSDRAELIAEGLYKLRKYDAEPHIGERTFIVMAVTRVEPEGLLDVWFIDRFGEPRCLTPETTDMKARRWKLEWDTLTASFKGAKGADGSS